MRITARIDDSYERKIKAIQEATHLNTTDIIKQAIDLLYEKTEISAKEKNQKLLQMLSGIGEGPDDLSENYKQYLHQGWKEKYDLD